MESQVGINNNAYVTWTNGSGHGVRVNNNNGTATRTIQFPDANGTIVVNTKVLVTHAIAYYNNGSSDYVIPLAGTSHSDNTNLSLYIVQYFLMATKSFDADDKKF